MPFRTRSVPVPAITMADTSERAGVEILCVGTELLLGNIVNSNSRWLAEELAALGLPHLRQTVVVRQPGSFDSSGAGDFVPLQGIDHHGRIGPDSR